MACAGRMGVTMLLLGAVLVCTVHVVAGTSGFLSQAPEDNRSDPGSFRQLEGSCSVAWEDCRASKCCADPSLTCYEMSQWWAACRPSCTPGSWTCNVLGDVTTTEASSSSSIFTTTTSTTTSTTTTTQSALWDCFFDQPVLITSHRNENLQDDNGNVHVSSNTGRWEQWVISDAGNDKVFIRSHRSENLQDDNGNVHVSINTGGWEQWTISDAGDGKIFIGSHRNENLQDNDGRVQLSSNTGWWEQWTIHDTSGTPLSCGTPSATTTTTTSTVSHCFFGHPVLITSHRNDNLQDDHGNIHVSSNTGWWEQWVISDAGDDKVFIRSHRSEHLQDDNGNVHVSGNTGLWEQWTISDAADGKVFIGSHRNENLQDNDGRVQLSSNIGWWEQWTIRDTSGIPLSCGGPSTTASAATTPMSSTSTSRTPPTTQQPSTPTSTATTPKSSTSTSSTSPTTQQPSTPTSTTTAAATTTTTRFSVSTTTFSTDTRLPVEQHGRLQVRGNTIFNQHGEPVRLRGMSFFWSQWQGHYWTADTVRWLRDDWHVTLVRAAMGIEHAGGYLASPATEKAKVITIVEAAIEVGIYVIIDWHDHAAEQHVTQADDFFTEMAQTYGNVPNVIFETYNEPIGQSWAGEIKPYHEQIVSTIRSHSDNLIILGTPFYSQRVDDASLDPVQGDNLAYTIHFYAAAQGHRDQLRDRVERALSNGIALFSTEWGTCQEWGSGNLDFEDAQTWLDLFAVYHISDANWALSNKDETCSALRGNTGTSGWTDADLTPSGTWVRNSILADSGVGTMTRTTTTYTGTTVTQTTDRSCARDGTENCVATRCCMNPAWTCFEKNQWWASCKASCTPGIDPTDPPQHQTPWTCTVLGQ